VSGRGCLWTLLVCSGFLLIVLGEVFVGYFQLRWTSVSIEGRGSVPNSVRTYPFIGTGVVLIVLGVVTATAAYLKSIGRIRLRRSRETKQNPP